MGILDDIHERKAAMSLRPPTLAGVVERKTEIAQGAMRIGVQDRPRYPDVSPESLVLEVSGTPDKVQNLVKLLEPYGIAELVQTGVISMTRGSKARELGPPTLTARSA